MEKYKLAMVQKDVTIEDSFIEEEQVKIWSRARIKNSKLKRNVSIGNDSIIVKSTIDENCEIGRRNIISNSVLGKGTSTQGNTSIRFCNVGKYVAIAWNVTIGAPNHDIHRLAMAQLNYIFKDEECEHLSSFEKLSCSIGNDVWIAAGAHILRNVHISDGVVVAANAVVTKDVPPYAIVAGVPAKIIGYRFNTKIIEELLEICWWDFSEEKLEKAKFLFDGEVTEKQIKYLKEIKYE